MQKMWKRIGDNPTHYCSMWATGTYRVFFIYILSLRHAPLHNVILHARFALIHVYMISYCGAFLFLVVWAFVFLPCSLHFFEINGVCKHRKLF
jgi:hypothetical protein